MAENLVPSNISQGVNIPRAERVKPSFLGKLEERFGSRKAPLDAEQETHAKEKVGRNPGTWVRIPAGPFQP